MTLVRTATVREPWELRVPKRMRRAMTQWRNMRSARLFLIGSPG